MGDSIRKIKISHNQKESRADNKNVVVVFVDVGKCTGAGFGDYHIYQLALVPSFSPICLDLPVKIEETHWQR